MLADRRASSWEVLSVMQHHGVPTRLMDWTDTLFVALYFALEYPAGATRGIDGRNSPPTPCIWLLNPFALNDRSVKRTVIFDEVDPLPGKAYERFIGTIRTNDSLKRWPPELPVAAAPTWGHSRATRQRGFFTIHGTKPNPLDELVGKKILQRIEIPRELQSRLRQLLRDAGVDHYSVFPDLEGLARKLRQRYGWT